MAAAEGEKDRPFTAIVCDYDPIWHARAIARVRAHGFEVLGQATTVVDALRVSKDHKPSLVVVSNEHYGLTALEAIEDFRRQPHRPEVLVLSTSQVDRQRFLSLGALLLVGRFDNDGFDHALEETKEFLTTGERRKTDRRSHRERRLHQDWQMVTKERRGATDRREAQRRAAAVHAAADASVAVAAPTRPIGPEEQVELDNAAAAKLAAELAAGAVARAVRGMSARAVATGTTGPGSTRAGSSTGPAPRRAHRSHSTAAPTAPRRVSAEPAAARPVPTMPPVPGAVASDDTLRGSTTAVDLERVMQRAVARANELATDGGAG